MPYLGQRGNVGLCEFSFRSFGQSQNWFLFLCWSSGEKSRQPFLHFLFLPAKWRKPYLLKCRFITNSKILRRGSKGDMQEAIAPNNLLIPLSFPWAPCSSPKESLGYQWWHLWWALLSLSCTLHHAAPLPTSSPLQMQEASAQKPEHSTCNSVTWISCFFVEVGVLCYLNTAFSWRRPQYFLALSPLPPQR